MRRLVALLVASALFTAAGMGAPLASASVPLATYVVTFDQPPSTDDVNVLSGIARSVHAFEHVPAAQVEPADHGHSLGTGRNKPALEELESIATSFEGVRQAFAIEAGREVRVIVDAVRVDDRSSLKLARYVARKIEEQMVTFPGEIKITVLREVRATEYAISGRHRGAPVVDERL